MDDFGGHGQERFVKAAQQRHGPFGQAGVFDDQAFVFDQHQSGLRRSSASAFAHDAFAFCMIEDHMRGAQFRGVVIRAVDRDRAGMVKPVAHCFAAGDDAADFAMDDLTAQQRDDARQRAHPAQAFARQRCIAPALRFGPGERADQRGDGFGQHIRGRATGLFDHGKPHAIAIDQLVHSKPGLAQKALKRLGRRARARALGLLAERLSRQRQIARDQRKTAGRGPDVDCARRQPGAVQRLGKQPGEIGARAGLHPRGNFLAAQFEQEIAHALHPGNFTAHSSLNLSI